MVCVERMRLPLGLMTVIEFLLVAVDVFIVGVMRDLDAAVYKCSIGQVGGVGTAGVVREQVCYSITSYIYV